MSDVATADTELSGLLTRVVEGDEAALATLYRRLSRRIYAFALQRLSQPEAAEEVVVETMFEVWQHAARFRGQSRVSTWVLGIARHKAIDKLRQRNLREVADDEDFLEAIPDETPLAFDRIAQRQQAQQVVDCMEALPEVQRECLHFAFYEDMGLAEISELQECPENTVKTRLFHARRKMRDCLEKQTNAGVAS